MEVVVKVVVALVGAALVVYDRLAAAGITLVADREQAWRDFAGWRVNHYTVLLAWPAW